MDYQRIYSDFIADRLGKQPTKPTYFERHHIVPRSLGGGDEKSNLIRLTPEDHFFAHLLLAKIHGGQMWSPVALMVGGRVSYYKPTISRIKHGWASRAMAKAKSGRGAYNFDVKTYHLVNQSGEEWLGHQSEMHTQLGMTKPLANLLIKGKCQSALGWWFHGNPQPTTSGDKHHMYTHQRYDFVHVDGREFHGTQFEFYTKFNLNRSGVCNLVNKQSSVYIGWHLRGAVINHNGRSRKWLKASGAVIPDRACSVLTETQIASICTKAQSGYSRRSIAIEHGVSPKTIAMVVRRSIPAHAFSRNVKKSALLGNKHSAKVTPEDVMKIHELWQSGKLKQNEIARLFSIQQSLVSRIVSGKRWPESYELFHG